MGSLKCNKPKLFGPRGCGGDFLLLERLLNVISMTSQCDISVYAQVYRRKASLKFKIWVGLNHPLAKGGLNLG